MKRHPQLQPLSREHHHALTLAKACERAAESCDAGQQRLTCQRVLHAMEQELEPHFRREEQAFLPWLTQAEEGALAQRTLDEHHRLRALLPAIRRGDGQALAAFGQLLAAHVRFEEKELFPALERCLD